MSVYYKEFMSDDEAIRGVQEFKTKGIQQDDIYLVTHEDYRTKKLSEMASANTVGLSEQGLGTSIANVFNSKGAELRSKFEELGFSQSEAEQLEKRLDEHTVVVVVKNAPPHLS